MQIRELASRSLTIPACESGNAFLAHPRVILGSIGVIGFLVFFIVRFRIERYALERLRRLPQPMGIGHAAHATMLKLHYESRGVHHIGSSPLLFDFGISRLLECVLRHFDLQQYLSLSQ